MPPPVTFVGHGRAFALAADNSDLLDALVAAVPPGFVARRASTTALYRLAADRDGDGWSLHCDASLVAHAATLDEVIALFAGHTVFSAALEGRAHCYLHAGAVAFGGQAVLLPGRSGAGKSTLTAALVRLGGAYLSDEYALIDDAGLVHPFARPLSLDDGRGRFTSVEPSKFGAVESSPRFANLVVLAEFDPVRLVSFDERPLSAGEGVAALLPFAMSLQGNPSATMRRLEALLRRAPVIRASRGDADEFAEALVRRLSALSSGDQIGSDQT